MLIVHYHKLTGRISAWGDADAEQSHLADHEIARIEDVSPADVDATLHKIDLENGCIVDTTAEERLASLRPWVDGAIAAELAATDQFMMPDRPLDDATRAAWRDYRRRLRDLTGDAAAILRAWPARPDDTDPVAHLRAQLDEASQP